MHNQRSSNVISLPILRDMREVEVQERSRKRAKKLQRIRFTRTICMAGFLGSSFGWAWEAFVK